MKKIKALLYLLASEYISLDELEGLAVVCQNDIKITDNDLQDQTDKLASCFGDGLTLTRLEVEAIRKRLSGHTVWALDSDNKREQAEWVEKAAKLGLRVG